MQVYEASIAEKLAQMDALRCIVTMALSDTGQTAEHRQQFAFDGIARFRAVLMPWLRENTQQNTGNPMDDLLDWYATFRPDLLEEAMRHG
jgi:hypothetical protein